MSSAAQPFQDPLVTLDGSHRASVEIAVFETLWFNTGTLCNLTCQNCYIESSPKNDRLVYLSEKEVISYLDQIKDQGHPVRQIGFTGGEPFMCPDIIPMLSECLSRGYDVLVLTNAMRPMMRWQPALEKLANAFGEKLTVRVSLDHYTQAVFEAERGANSWRTTLDGIQWLTATGIETHIAARSLVDEDEDRIRHGFRALFDANGILLDANDPAHLVIFPEMDEQAEVPEITTECWETLGVDPDDMMCASSRMIVKEKGDAAPHVVACTLLPFDDEFNMGANLADALGPVRLNHAHCAKFCVLGGGSCSA